MEPTIEQVDRQKLEQIVSALPLEALKALGEIDDMRAGTILQVASGSVYLWLPMDPSKILDLVCNMVKEATGHHTEWKAKGGTMDVYGVTVYITHPRRDNCPIPKISASNFQLASLQAYAEACKIERSNKES